MSLPDSRWIGVDAPIGVVGGYGAVGRSVLRHLLAWGAPTIRAAGRRPEAVRALADELGHRVPVDVVNIDDPVALAAFCARCDIVVNCAGPSCLVQDRVAGAALGAGAHYVDPGGDDPLHHQLTTSHAGAARPLTSAVLSAGMLPGLTGLLPRLLARSFDQPTTLVGYAGGVDRFTLTAATDYCDSLRNGFGRSRTAWRRGRREAVPGSAPSEVELPLFPNPAVLAPYLSTEMERVAAALALEEATFYNVFLGANVRAALTENPVEPGALVDASVVDQFGRDPYQRLVFQMDGLLDGRLQSRTLVLAGRGASELTGAMAALATMAVARAEVPSGIHFAADVLDPTDAAARLETAQAVVGFDLLGDPALGELAEEGVL